jgi:aspartyl-tRNA(Asn)/glutamyl-tRNA(Gln) amidotransferase subunit A
VIAPAESAVSKTSRSLRRIAALDGELRSCILVREAALGEAAAIDTGSGALGGMSIAVKDNMDVAGTVRTDGLGPPHPDPAPEDCAAVRRIRRAGGVIVAKTNLEQVSFGATTQNPTWGSCRNPWDTSRIPGGSSGETAVAVAAGFADVGLGTDTGGSLRNPASFCGVSSLRPTHGLVPVEGVTPLSPSLDVVGPVAYAVADLRRVLAVLAGGLDASADRPLAAITVGVPEAYFLDDLEPDVAAAFDELLGLFRREGTRVEPLAFPNMVDVAEATAVLLNAEAAQSLGAYWDDSRLAEGIRERLELGRAATARSLAAAARIAKRWREAVEAAFTQVTVLATPTTPFVAPRVTAENLVALSRRINRLTGCWSLVGAPVLSIPLERPRDGLPVGGQLVAGRGCDSSLLAVGEAVQSVSDWHRRRPALVSEPAPQE